MGWRAVRLTSDRANGEYQLHDVYQSCHTINADSFSRSRSYSSRPCCALSVSLSAVRSILFARRRLAFHRGGANGLKACVANSTIASIESEQVWSARRAKTFLRKQPNTAKYRVYLAFSQVYLGITRVRTL